jgi:hypothetical protein
MLQGAHLAFPAVLASLWDLFDFSINKVGKIETRLATTVRTALRMAGEHVSNMQFLAWA